MILIISVIYLAVILFRFISIIRGQSDLVQIMNWISERYRPRSDDLIAETSKIKFDNLNETLCKWAKYFFRICVISSVIAIILPFLMPQHPLMMPMHIPFIPVEGWPYFHINYAWQTIFITIILFHINTYIALFIFIMTHVIAELDLILDCCKKVGLYEEWVLDVEEFKLNWKDFNEGKIKVMPIFPRKPENCVKFQKILPTIVQLHVDVTSIISVISDFFSTNILLWEIMLVCEHVESYFIITWYREMIHFVPMDSVMIAQYFGLCYLCLIMSEKYEEIGDEIYASKWYCLNKYEKKSLVIVMMKAQQASTLTSAGLANMHLERFTDVGLYEGWILDVEEFKLNWKDFNEGKIKVMPIFPKKPENCVKFKLILPTIVNLHGDVTRDMIYFVPMSFIIIAQYFGICYLSLIMKEKYEEIGDEIYASKWYCLTKYEKKSLVIVMMKSQQTSTLTSAGLANMDLERFTDVSKIN
uniref:Odorant receptor n=1 Tax=Culicoides sonorensis TaxID=179676 RepID=A0A336K6J4_CULSO